MHANGPELNNKTPFAKRLCVQTEHLLLFEALEYTTFSDRARPSVMAEINHRRLGKVYWQFRYGVAGYGAVLSIQSCKMDTRMRLHVVKNPMAENHGTHHVVPVSRGWPWKRAYRRRKRQEGSQTCFSLCRYLAYGELCGLVEASSNRLFGVGL